MLSYRRFHSSTAFFACSAQRLGTGKHTQFSTASGQMISSSKRGWKQALSSSLRYAAVLCLTASLTAVAHAQALRQVPSAIKTAGTGSAGFNNDFGPASGVELNAPSTNLFDGQGNQYISDAKNNCVRRVDLAGSVTTIIGLDQAGPGDTCNASLNPTPTAAQG